MKKIALFGGSFDPPHTGHIAIIEEALEQLDIEKIVVVPAYVNPFKSGSHAPAVLRLAWLNQIFDHRSDVKISGFEVLQERPVRSIETVKHFKDEADQIYFIIGADNLASLTQWHRYDELNDLVTWVVAARDGIDVPVTFITLDIAKPVSSTELRETIKIHELPESVAQEITQFYKEKNAKKN
ncbi:MAG: nicotinate (nicotinamide) nucleotide adenylyltransferase [Campylobacterota bacterium]|nr:nicotinate (nicotinamide) nucleotide adenylyltransferase [Campylobacterota bacterium]